MERGVGEWTLAAWRVALGRGEEGAAEVAGEVAHTVAHRLLACGRLRAGEVDDARQEILLRALRDAAKEAPAGVKLVAWLHGIAINVAHEIARRRARDRRSVAAAARAVEDGIRGRSVRHADADDVRETDGWRHLTDKQRAAVELRCRGLSVRDAARELGIGRDSYRDRLRRALRVLAAGGRRPPAGITPPDEASSRRSWIRCAVFASHAGRVLDARIAAMRAAGRTYREIATATGIRPEAARKRLSRLVRRHAEASALSAPPPPGQS